MRSPGVFNVDRDTQADKINNAYGIAAGAGYAGSDTDLAEKIRKDILNEYHQRRAQLPQSRLRKPMLKNKTFRRLMIGTTVVSVGYLLVVAAVLFWSEVRHPGW